MKSFNEYCKIKDQNINEFLGMFNKSPQCPKCGANLNVDNNVTRVGDNTKQYKHYNCFHCEQDYILDTKTGALEKVGNVMFDD